MLKLNTFSITARCPRTGEFGVAVSTKVPAVGSLCPFARADVGAIASQSFVNPYLGIWGLQHLAEGLSAEETLGKLLASDPDAQKRQLAVVDRDGRAAAFTGTECDTWNGHRTGDGYAVAGNMLVGRETIDAMAVAFEAKAGESLAERLLSALEAGQQAGGDKRGRQSAALYVVATEEYPLLDLRVDEHQDPVRELRRVYEVVKVQLLPLMRMLPTKENPAGTFDLALTRKMGLLQDGKPA